MSRFEDLTYEYTPGTEEEFCEWLGITPKELEESTAISLEDIPVMKKFHIRPLGGKHHLDEVKFTWETMEQSENFQAFEKYIGRGANYHDAAISGLMVMWEMWHHRTTQGTITG